MKKYAALCIILSTSLLLSFSKNERRSMALEYLKHYCPDGHYIVQEYIKAPASVTFDDGGDFQLSKTDFVVYVEGATRLEVLISLSTVVHEMCHGYTSHIGTLKKTREQVYNEKDQIAVYNTNGQTILVPLTKIFPSREMAHTFDRSIQTFRFSYISTTQANLGTQMQGIYGLLDELNAYCHGTETGQRLVPAMLKTRPMGLNEYIKILQSLYSGYYAHYEFKLFILKYLIYAAKYKPDVYKGIMANTPFKQAFCAVDARFTILENKLDTYRDMVLQHAKNAHYSVSEDDKNIFFMKDNSGMGAATFKDVAKLLKTELNKQVYRSMMQALGAGNPGSAHPSKGGDDVPPVPDM